MAVNTSATIRLNLEVGGDGWGQLTSQLKEFTDALKATGRTTVNSNMEKQFNDLDRQFKALQKSSKTLQTDLGNANKRIKELEGSLKKEAAAAVAAANGTGKATKGTKDLGTAAQGAVHSFSPLDEAIGEAFQATKNLAGETEKLKQAQRDEVAAAKAEENAIMDVFNAMLKVTRETEKQARDNAALVASNKKATASYGASKAVLATLITDLGKLDKAFMNSARGKQFENMRRELVGMAQAGKTIPTEKVRAYAQAVQQAYAQQRIWGADLQKIAGRLTFFEQQMDAVLRASYRFKSAGNDMMQFGRSIMTAFKGVMDTFGQFDYNIRRAAGSLGMVTDYTGGITKGLSDLARGAIDAAREIKMIPIEEVAKGFYFWGSMTGEVVKNMDDVNRLVGEHSAVLKAAAMTEVGFETALKGVYSVLTQFYNGNLAHTVEVTEKMFYVTQKTATEFGDLINAFKMVGPVASGMNVSFDDVLTTLGDLSDLGMRGTMAGRAIRQIFIQAVKPSKMASELLDETFKSFKDGFDEIPPTVQRNLDRVQTATGSVLDNIRNAGSYYDAIFPQGKYAGIQNQLDVLATMTMDMTEAERSHILGVMSTANSLPVLMAMVGRKVNELQVDVQKQSKMNLKEAKAYFDENWALLSESWKGTTGALARAWESLKVTIGTTVAQVLTPLFDKLTDVVDKIRDWADANPELVAGFAKIATYVGVFAGVGGAIVTVTGTIIGLLGVLNVGFKSFFPRLAGVTSAASAASQALATDVSAAFEIVEMKVDDADKAMQGFVDFVKGAGKDAKLGGIDDAFVKFQANAKAAGTASEEAFEKVEASIRKIKVAAETTTADTARRFLGIVGVIAGVAEAIVRNWDYIAVRIKGFFDAINGTVGTVKKTTDDLTGLTAQAAKNIEGMGDTIDGVTDSVGNLQTAWDTMSRVFDQFNQGVILVFDQLVRRVADFIALLGSLIKTIGDVGSWVDSVFPGFSEQISGAIDLVSKLIGVMVGLSAVRAIFTLISGFSMFKKVADAAKLAVLAVRVELATTSATAGPLQGVRNAIAGIGSAAKAAGVALKSMLISTGVGLLIVGISMFIEAMGEAQKSSEDLRMETQALAASFGEAADDAEDAARRIASGFAAAQRAAAMSVDLPDMTAPEGAKYSSAILDMTDEQMAAYTQLHLTTETIAANIERDSQAILIAWKNAVTVANAELASNGSEYTIDMAAFAENVFDMSKFGELKGLAQEDFTKIAVEISKIDTSLPREQMVTQLQAALTTVGNDVGKDLSGYVGVMLNTIWDQVAQDAAAQKMNDTALADAMLKAGIGPESTMTQIQTFLKSMIQIDGKMMTVGEAVGGDKFGDAAVKSLWTAIMKGAGETAKSLTDANSVTQEELGFMTTTLTEGLKNFMYEAINGAMPGMNEAFASIGDELGSGHMQEAINIMMNTVVGEGFGTLKDMAVNGQLPDDIKKAMTDVVQKAVDMGIPGSEDLLAALKGKETATLGDSLTSAITEFIASTFDAVMPQIDAEMSRLISDVQGGNIAQALADIVNTDLGGEFGTFQNMLTTGNMPEQYRDAVLKVLELAVKEGVPGAQAIYDSVQAGAKDQAGNMASAMADFAKSTADSFMGAIDGGIKKSFKEIKKMLNNRLLHPEKFGDAASVAKLLKQLSDPTLLFAMSQTTDTFARQKAEEYFTNNVIQPTIGGIDAAVAAGNVGAAKHDMKVLINKLTDVPESYWKDLDPTIRTNILNWIQAQVDAGLIPQGTADTITGKIESVVQTGVENIKPVEINTSDLVKVGVGNQAIKNIKGMEGADAARAGSGAAILDKLVPTPEQTEVVTGKIKAQILAAANGAVAQASPAVNTAGVTAAQALIDGAASKETDVLNEGITLGRMFDSGLGSFTVAIGRTAAGMVSAALAQLNSGVSQQRAYAGGAAIANAWTRGLAHISGQYSAFKSRIDKYARLLGGSLPEDGPLQHPDRGGKSIADSWGTALNKGVSKHLSSLYKQLRGAQGELQRRIAHNTPNDFGFWEQQIKRQKAVVARIQAAIRKEMGKGHKPIDRDGHKGTHNRPDHNGIGDPEGLGRGHLNELQRRVNEWKSQIETMTASIRKLMQGGLTQKERNKKLELQDQIENIQKKIADATSKAGTGNKQSRDEIAKQRKAIQDNMARIKRHITDWRTQITGYRSQINDLFKGGLTTEEKNRKTWIEQLIADAQFKIDHGSKQMRNLMERLSRLGKGSGKKNWIDDPVGLGKKGKGAPYPVDDVIDTLNGSKKDANTAGENLIHAWADGFEKGIAYAVKKAKDVASAVKKILFGNSPPVAGPLHDIDRGGYNIGKAWGDNLGKGALKGVHSAVLQARREFADMPTQQGSYENEMNNTKTIKVEVDVSSKDGSVDQLTRSNIKNDLVGALAGQISHYVTVS